MAAMRFPWLPADFQVTAVDASAGAIAALRFRANDLVGRLLGVLEGVEQFEFIETFDVIIAHGLLQLLPIQVQAIGSCTRCASTPLQADTISLQSSPTRFPPPDLEAAHARTLP